MRWIQRLYRKIAHLLNRPTVPPLPVGTQEIIAIDSSQVKRVIPITSYRPVFHTMPDQGTSFTQAACGHTQWQYATLYLGTEPVIALEQSDFTPDEELSGPCFDCVLKKSHAAGLTACTFCGRPIAIGDNVSLYRSELTTVQRARASYDSHGHYLGCLDTDCCPSGGYLAGIWNGASINSPFETGSVVGEVLRTGTALVWSAEK